MSSFQAVSLVTDVILGTVQPSGTGQPLLSARQCDRPEDKRDEEGCILSPSVHRQRGRRTTVEVMGTQQFDSGSRRRPSKLPTIHQPAKG